VGVLGLGLIGGSLLRRLATVPGFEVRGFDAAEEVRTAAAAEGFGIDARLAGWAEVVAVAVPPRATAAAVVSALAASDAAVFDVASVKAPVVAAVRAVAPAGSPGRYVPAHPLAGSERGGWESSRPELLDAAVWAVCPHDLAAPLEPLAAVARVLDAFDARMAFCTPKDHDAAVARSSHVPHVVASALATTIDTPLAAVLSGGALRDATRVAGADAELWTSLLALNREHVPAVLDAVLSTLDHLRARLEQSDDDAVARAWAAGLQRRRRVEELRWLEPAWSEVELRGAILQELVEAGREGRVARRLRIDGELLRCELSRTSSAMPG